MNAIRCWVVTIAAVALLGASAQDSAKPSKVLKEGTAVHLKLAERLNSRAAKPGDAVELTLAEDLKIDEQVVVKSGSRALGNVVHAKKPDFWG